MYVDGISDETIALRLNHDGIPCPSAHDAARNPHRTKKAWQAGAVRAILLNPRYTGHEVWNKQRKEERLLDIDDVTLGHRTTMTHNPSDEWIWSNEPAHEPLITKELFEAPCAPAGSAPASTSGRTGPTGEAADGPTSCEDG
ncbi:recombinase family protein [Streptomyces sp. NPDC002076]